MTDTSEWAAKIEATDNLCPHTIHCADDEGRPNEDNPECELVEVRTREIDTTHEWVTKECQRDGCDGRRWFRRQSATTLGEF